MLRIYRVRIHQKSKKQLKMKINRKQKKPNQRLIQRPSSKLKKKAKIVSSSLQKMLVIAQPRSIQQQLNQHLRERDSLG